MPNKFTHLAEIFNEGINFQKLPRP